MILNESLFEDYFYTLADARIEQTIQIMDLFYLEPAGIDCGLFYMEFYTDYENPPTINSGDDIPSQSLFISSNRGDGTKTVILNETNDPDKVAKYEVYFRIFSVNYYNQNPQLIQTYDPNYSLNDESSEYYDSDLPVLSMPGIDVEIKQIVLNCTYTPGRLLDLRCPRPTDEYSEVNTDILWLNRIPDYTVSNLSPVFEFLYLRGIFNLGCDGPNGEKAKCDWPLGYPDGLTGGFIFLNYFPFIELGFVSDPKAIT